MRKLVVSNIVSVDGSFDRAIGQTFGSRDLGREAAWSV
jgi:hypothetical protein